MIKISKSAKTLIISPNIGIPTVINMKENVSTFKLKILIFEENENLKSDRILDIKLIPLINLQWKINYLLEKNGIWLKLKQLWRKLINKFKSDDKKKYREIEITEIDKEGVEKQFNLKLNEKEIKKYIKKPFRTTPIFTKIMKISPASPIQIQNPIYLNNQHYNPQHYLLRLFPDKPNNFFIVDLEFSLNMEIRKYLEDFNSILFDILYKSSDHVKKINYHSLLISRNNWKDFKIVHATDLHLAKRNDSLFEKISNHYKENSPELTQKQVFKKVIDLKKRIVNPNRILRNFIKLMNEKVLQNNLDFIFFTGDIVDFTVNSQHKPDENDIFTYEKSNWKIFKEIILNKSEDKDSEELICPIFTILGNHDYKPWQYDLNWLGIYKKVGITKVEAKVLKDEYSASPIKAILKSNKSIDAYLLEINPFLNFSLKLGKFLFIFLNSGSDSYKDLTDYITGSPSLTGINQKQMILLENLKNRYPKEDIVLCMHGPPINTPLKRGVLSRFKKLFNREIKTTIDYFKESKFKTFEEKIIKARIDDKFNIEYGTISSNWKNLLDYCFKNCILTISGHTHIPNEYRLLNIKNSHSNNLENSLAIFYDDYSKFCDNKRKIMKYKPFIVQTPALGFKSYKKPGKVGGFRELIIKDNSLISFKVKYTK